jgi:hypothetical protein
MKMSDSNNCKLFECDYCTQIGRGQFLDTYFWDYFCKWKNRIICEGQKCFINDLKDMNKTKGKTK